MDTVKFNNKKTKIIAHRGLSGLECENTNAAFVAAANRGYYGIETDVHITADGMPIIFHDDNTKRMAGIDMSVEASRYDELKKLKLYDQEKDRYRSDLFMPDLTDYIRICKRYGKMAVLEIKNSMSPEAISMIIRIIVAENYLDDTIFISFCWENLLEIKKKYPNQIVQFLTSSWDEELLKKLIRNDIDLDIWYLNVSKELVEKCHKHNIQINCWTCDIKKEAEKLVSYGVDYITTNILEGNA